MDGWVRVLRPFNSISVISRWWKGEHERLCATKCRLGSGRISLPAGFEPATLWSEVGSANRSATRTLLDVDVLIVKILLKLVFLQVIVPNSLSKCIIQQVAHLRMLFIWLNVNVVTCNTLVKQINKFPNVWIVIDLISIITMIKAMLLMLLCISIQIHIHLTDFRFVPIDMVNNEMDRLCKETYWIHKLDTLHPKGMNSKLLYNIK